MAETTERDFTDLSVSLVGPQQVHDVLDAEYNLLGNLIAEVDKALPPVNDSSKKHIRDWLINYWREPLEDHRKATLAWRNGVNTAGGFSPTRDSARHELDAIHGLLGVAQLYRRSFDDSSENDPTLLAFASWLTDLRGEVEAKRAIINALPKV